MVNHEFMAIIIYHSAGCILAQVIFKHNDEIVASVNVSGIDKLW
jgi:hypothetical protein